SPLPYTTLFRSGLWLAIPGAIVLIAGAVCIRKRLSADRTPIYWVRAGAVSGMIAAAVQSTWETGLRRPAHTLLFAILAAIAMHLAPERARPSSLGGATT